LTDVFCHGNCAVLGKTGFGEAMEGVTEEKEARVGCCANFSRAGKPKQKFSERVKAFEKKERAKEFPGRKGAGGKGALPR